MTAHKRAIDRAVHAARLYHGSDGRSTIRDADRLYQRMRRAIDAVATVTGVDSQDAWDQITARARALGAIVPQPGKDL